MGREGRKRSKRGVSKGTPFRRRKPLRFDTIGKGRLRKNPAGKRIRVEGKLSFFKNRRQKGR